MDLVQQYQRAQAAVRAKEQQLTAARTRLEGVEDELRQAAQDIRTAGFSDVPSLEAEVARLEAEARQRLDEAEAALR